MKHIITRISVSLATWLATVIVTAVFAYFVIAWYNQGVETLLFGLASLAAIPASLVQFFVKDIK